MVLISNIIRVLVAGSWLRGVVAGTSHVEVRLIRTPENPHRGLIKGPKFGDRKMAIFGDLDETFVPKSANLGGVRCL